MAGSIETSVESESAQSHTWRDRLNHHPWVSHALLLLLTIAAVTAVSYTFLLEFLGTITIWIGMLLIRLTGGGGYFSMMQAALLGSFAGILILPQIIFYAVRKRRNKLLFGTVFLAEYVVIAAILHGVYCQESFRCVQAYRNVSVSKQELTTKCGPPLHTIQDGRGVYTDGGVALAVEPVDDKNVEVVLWGMGLWLD